MQEIILHKLGNFIEEIHERPCVITDEPCDRLLELQNAGYCILAELKHLQGLADEEVAAALCKEDAVMQYANVCIDAGKLPQAYFRRIWCRHVGEPVLIAETERLIIRESVEEDAEAFLELYQDTECRKYLEMPPVDLDGDRERDVAEFRRYIAQYQAGQYAFYEYGMWSVEEKESGRCIGRVGLEQQRRCGETTADGETKEMISLGYAFMPDYRGKGYAAEACLAVLDYCKECEYADEVYVKMDVENTASRNVFEKIKKQSLVRLKLQCD